MKKEVKIAIIGGIAAVLAAVIPVIIPYLLPNKEKESTPGKKQTQEISVHNSSNVVTGNVNAGGDVIIGGTKTTTNIHPLSKK